jgi:hypothetical protein
MCELGRLINGIGKWNCPARDPWFQNFGVVRPPHSILPLDKLLGRLYALYDTLSLLWTAVHADIDEYHPAHGNQVNRAKQSKELTELQQLQNQNNQDQCLLQKTYQGMPIKE